LNKISNILKFKSLTPLEKKTEIHPLVFLALGVIALCIGGSLCLDNYAFYSKAFSASAEIVSMKELSGKGGLHSYLDVQFLSDTHKSVRASVARHGGGYQMGGKITVYYLPNQFSDVRTKDFWDTYGPVVFLWAGLFFVFFSSMELRLKWKTRLKKEV
jgi:hypothetical protein